MKKFNAFIIAASALALLSGCDNKKEFKSIEIYESPKTTFYCGEAFSNTGISLKVNFSDGSYIISENVQTSNPSTKAPGKQEVKVYYTNDEYDVDTFIKYEINVIDWSKEEKAIFGETSISSLSGVYYPKMEGMELLVETDDTTNEIVDYWIEKKNSSLEEVKDYLELLRNYSATKKVSTDNGETVDMSFKFYEQSFVPSDYRDYYDEHDLFCFKYCASYTYYDEYFTEHELYGNEIEDTLVIGLNDDNDMVIRFIADSIYLEGMFTCEVNEHLDSSALFNGTVLEYISQLLKGYTDEEEGVRYKGYIEELAPLAKDYIILPNYEADVCSIANYASMYPWLHGEDDLCFEVEVASNDVDEYNSFINSIEAIGDFTKTTRVDKINRKDVNVNIYTIENKDYVGDLVIEVTDMMDDNVSYSTTSGTVKTRVTVDSYKVYYRWAAPEVICPAQVELFKIYNKYFGEGNYGRESYDIYEDGEIIGVVNYTTKNDNISNKEDALAKFVEEYLNGYTCDTPAESITAAGYDSCHAKYQNGEFEVDIYSYYSGSKFAVEFSIKGLVS